MASVRSFLYGSRLLVIVRLQVSDNRYGTELPDQKEMGIGPPVQALAFGDILFLLLHRGLVNVVYHIVAGLDESISHLPCCRHCRICIHRPECIDVRILALVASRIGRDVIPLPGHTDRVCTVLRPAYTGIYGTYGHVNLLNGVQEIGRGKLSFRILHKKILAGYGTYERGSHKAAIHYMFYIHFSHFYLVRNSDALRMYSSC